MHEQVSFIPLHYAAAFGEGVDDALFDDGNVLTEGLVVAHEVELKNTIVSKTTSIQGRGVSLPEFPAPLRAKSCA